MRPLTALFGIVEPGRMKESYEVQAIFHLSSTLLARKLILQFWKSDLNCGNELHLEKIRFTTADIEELFEKIWQPVVHLLKS